MNDEFTGQPLADLAIMFRDLPVGLCTFDLDFRYIFVNKWLAALNGALAEEHIGRTIHEVIPDIAANAEVQLREVVETGKPVIGGEIVAETPLFPGEKRSFENTYTAVKDAEDGMIWVNCPTQDVTE
ncbi:MAG: PAS domain-containing protein, partial [Alphaproteobacteria bacterium]|nr:PAS domain-containing protein [Alphaproteobacteria bacterium]